MIGRLHYEIVRSLLDEGACPANAELERRLGITDAALESLIAEAAAGHALVPHPHVAEPWVVHPFSLTPTLNWVEGPTHGWWAPCIWCAFGIAALAGGRVSIHTRIGAEREPLVIPVKGGESETTEDICVHFAIPPARAWNNVHQHCALVLPFRSVDAIGDWCHRHNQPQGEPGAALVRPARPFRLEEVDRGRSAGDLHAGGPDIGLLEPRQPPRPLLVV